MADVCIIGAGASGLCAAIKLKQLSPQLSVALLERFDRAGKKIAVTGNGRCNLSNESISLENYHGADPDFAYPILKDFDVDALKCFLEPLGVLIKKSENGKLFPYSLQASSVADALRFETERLGVELLTNCEVQDIKKTNGGFSVFTNERIFCRAVIIACGGMAGGKLGSDSGYRLLKSLGHGVTELSPAIVQIKTDTAFTKQLKGVKTDALVKVPNGKQLLGEVLFCDYGLSGPPVLQLSRYLKKGDTISLDIMPEYNLRELSYMLNNRAKALKGIGNAEFFCGMLQKRLGQVVLKKCGFSINNRVDFNDKDCKKIASVIKNFSFEYFGTTGFANAQVTHGGARTDEFSKHTYMSKKQKGLFACGEVLDIDGDCGGYNLHFAFGSGIAAAKGCAEYLGCK